MKLALLNNMLDFWTQKLLAAGISTSRLDCLVLLEDATAKDRSWLLAHPEHQLPQKIVSALQEQIERRSKHEPLAYIRGKSEFYGRSFIVTADTLVPRPETETMFDLLKQIINLQNTSLLEVEPLTALTNVLQPRGETETMIELPIGARVKDEGLKVVDVGTGSGALAITVKLEFPNVEVIATDISAACLKIADQNAKNLEADIKFYCGDLLKPLSQHLTHETLLLCNLPYVPNSYSINKAATHEPKLALFGGVDGLDLYKRLFHQAKNMQYPPKYILAESLPAQHKNLQSIAKSASYQQQTVSDFIQVFVQKKYD